MSPRPPGRRRAVTLALVIFVSGAVAGGAIALTAVRHSTQSAFREPELVPARLAARMSRRLRLDPAQEAAVAGIIAERQAAWLEIRRSARPRVDAEIERLRREVAAVLRPRQAEQWDRWFERGRRRWLPRAEREPHRR